MARRKKSFKDRSPRHKSFVLQITSMVDMFTILLVFLLKSFASSPSHITPMKGLSLPSSNNIKSADQALKLIVSEKGIFVENQQVLAFKNRQLASTDLRKGDSDFITPLFNELEKQGKILDRIAKDEETARKVLMQADSSMSYDILKKVMYTTSLAGFPNLKLATISQD